MPTLQTPLSKSIWRIANRASVPTNAMFVVKTRIVIKAMPVFRELAAPLVFASMILRIVLGSLPLPSTRMIGQMRLPSSSLTIARVRLFCLDRSTKRRDKRMWTKRPFQPHRTLSRSEIVLETACAAIRDVVPTRPPWMACQLPTEEILSSSRFIPLAIFPWDSYFVPLSKTYLRPI